MAMPIWYSILLIAVTFVFIKLIFHYLWRPNKKLMIEGTVVLMPKNVLGYNDIMAATIDDMEELLGVGYISLQLVSSTIGDPKNGKKGKIAYLSDWVDKTGIKLKAGEAILKVYFEWEKDIEDDIGALIIKNNHSSQFFLKTVTLTNFPFHLRTSRLGNDVNLTSKQGKGVNLTSTPLKGINFLTTPWKGINFPFSRFMPFHSRTIHFVCNSWVYPPNKFDHDRIFFPNKALLPCHTPKALQGYRTQELEHLRRDDPGTREECDRIYDYACYNDLGDPQSAELSRPILGGSAKYPYPRRVRTGRAPAKNDASSESRLPLIKELNVYVPRDESFGHLKMSDFLGNTLLGIVSSLAAEYRSIRDGDYEFETFKDVLQLFQGDDSPAGLDLFTGIIPNQFLNEVVPSNKAGSFKFPRPQVIQVNKLAWSTDEEFAREMLAGVNPVVIRCYQEPIASRQNSKLSDVTRSSSIKGHIQKNLIGVNVDDAIQNSKIFILDHHDTIMPYLRRINDNTDAKTYASRTFLYLQDDGTLKPIAIELSLPHPRGDEFGEISQVYTPAEQGVERSIWQLAKAYVAVNDSGVQQLVSHWLNTHAVMEPFIIATNRQLSALHPIYKLLHPHFRDTMYINALARQALINAGGIIESTFFPGKYAIEMSSAAYKNWVFTDQALPADLIKRKMAEEDSHSPHGVRLVIEDYPYAVDGLEIWSAIKKWVEDYCAFYYENDKMVQEDSELQPWWEEVVNKGHGDKKDETWWPKMKTVKELTETCTTIIWIASALHAAVNFGQYPYGGYPLNRPTLSRKFMPEPGTPDYANLETNEEKALLEIITDQWKSIRVLSVIEILSKHCSDEVYIGKSTDPDQWTADEAPKKAFKEFGKKLLEIESNITARNKDQRLKNRVGSAKLPYTLLYPSSVEGLTGMGIPNSVSI